jgi:ketosteroid isomerase-like protein
VFRLEFNEQSTATMIEIRGGRISEIRTYPVHAITLP